MRILIEIDEVANENEWIHLKNSLYVHDIVYKILPPEAFLYEPYSEIEEMEEAPDPKKDPGARGIVRVKLA